MKSHHLRRPAALAAMLTAVLAWGCGGEESTLRVERSWPAEGIRNVSVSVVNGPVLVEGVAGESIALDARLTGNFHDGNSEGGDRDAAVAELLEMTLEGDTLRIAQKETSRRFLFVPFFAGDEADVRISLSMPPDVALRVRSVNGSVKVAGIDRDLDLQSVNGSLEVSTPSAPLEARTVNGKVRAEFTDAFRGARLRTVNGSVSVTVPVAASIALDVRQTNGSFRSNIPVTIDGDEGPATDGEFPLEVTTVNGNVSLTERKSATASTGEKPVERVQVE